MEGQDNMKEAEVLHFPNAVIRIYRPDLTKEEKERRYKNLVEETTRFLKEVEKEKRRACNG